MNQYLAEEIRSHREHLGLTKTEAAKRADMGIQSLNTIESDPLSSSMEHILDYMTALGLELIVASNSNPDIRITVKKRLFRKHLESLHEGIDRRTAASMMDMTWSNVTHIETHSGCFPRFESYLKYLKTFGYYIIVKSKNE